MPGWQSTWTRVGCFLLPRREVRFVVHLGTSRIADQFRSLMAQEQGAGIIRMRLDGNVTAKTARLRARSSWKVPYLPIVEAEWTGTDHLAEMRIRIRTPYYDVFGLLCVVLFMLFATLRTSRELVVGPLLIGLGFHTLSYWFVFVATANVLERKLRSRFSLHEAIGDAVGPDSRRVL